MSEKEEKKGERPPRRPFWEPILRRLGPVDRSALALPSDGDFLFRVAAYGDNQKGVPLHERTVEAILASGAEVVLHTGDLVQDGRVEEQWDEQFRLPARPLIEGTDFLAVLGNHDKGSPRYYEILRPPGGKSWFSFERPPVVFIGLNTSRRYNPGTGQFAFLERTLKETACSWKIVFFHYPPYSSSWPWPGGTPRVRENLIPLLEKHGVSLVFNGHIHNYERSHRNGIPYIITGGGGDILSKPEQLRNPQKVWAAMLHHFCTVDVYPGRLVVLARDLSGVPFDGVVVQKGEGLEDVKLSSRRGYDGPRPQRYPGTLGSPWRRRRGRGRRR